jgi:lipopolysaccharide/colanic/teichoic acid biosynthesis glycosyltransferase
MLYPTVKRLFDICLAGFGLLVLLPCFALVALLMKLTDRGPVFYRQTRIGRFGRPFQIWKFRTMVVGAEKIGALVTHQHDPRMTRIGRILRTTKVDELPQLWNVLKGDMSFVGPRPQVPRYIERLTPAQREMLRLRPGITDIATLRFRNEQELLAGAADVDDFYIRHCLPRKIALNLEYARQASLPYDIWIILQTLCPYWLGVLALYAAILVSSLWISFELRCDFHVDYAERIEFLNCLPWMVVPQLAVLFLRRQCRGLVSYFSFLQLLQTGFALGIACVFHFVLRRVAHGRLVPESGIIATNFVLSFWGLTYARLSLRFMREGQSGKTSDAKSRVQRVAIVGAGELGTKVALDLITREDSREVVAFFDDDPRSWNKRPYDIPVVGMPECLLNSEWRDKVDEVIVALPELDATRPKEIGEMAKRVQLKVAYASRWPMLDATSAGT